MTDLSLSESYYMIFVLVALALAPFMAIMVTSFIKLVVVLSLIRNALGIQQIPPNLVINGLAMILSIYIMAPVGQEMMGRAQEASFNLKTFDGVSEAVVRAKEPLREFLKKHCNPRERMFFMRSAKEIWPPEAASELHEDHMLVLIPAFTVSELTAAFQIGFLIYLPFIAIDLVISNILLAMGMMMVSPMTISLPFKLLLFVLLNGWARLIHALVLTYA